MRYRIFIVFCLFISFPTILESAIGNSSLNSTIIHQNTPSELKSKSLGKSDSTLSSDSNSFKEEPLPVIFFAVYDKDEAFKEVKKWGGTHLHKYGMGKSIENDQSFFDRAKKFDLKVMSDLRSGYWLNESEDLESFNEYVNHFKEHSAFDFWYLSDEPDNKGFAPGELKPLYQSIQKITSNTPVAVSHAWTKNWYKYGNVQDVFMYNFYPILGRPFPETKLEEWTRFTEGVVREAEKDNNLVIPVLQIFNWKAFADDGQTEYRNYPVEKLRYPNSKELRYMIFSSVALGASGIALFSYSRLKMVEPKWGEEVLTPVLKEAKKFAKQVGDIDLQKVSSTRDQKILFTHWSNHNAEFIILANTTPDEFKVRLNIDTAVEELKGFKPWGQSRKSVKLSISEGQFIVNKISPWEIIILKQGNN